MQKLSLTKKSLKYYLIAIYLFHFLATQVMLPAFNTHSSYPFYNWDLFSHMPRYFKDWYFIRVHGLNDSVFDVPKVYVLNREILKPKAKWLLHDQIRWLGRAIEGLNDHPDQAHLQLGQNLFMRVESAEYEVIKGDIDIRTIEKTKEIENIKSLGMYTYKKKK